LKGEKCMVTRNVNLFSFFPWYNTELTFEHGKDQSVIDTCIRMCFFAGRGMCFAASTASYVSTHAIDRCSLILSFGVPKSVISTANLRTRRNRWWWKADTRRTNASIVSGCGEAHANN